MRRKLLFFIVFVVLAVIVYVYKDKILGNKPIMFRFIQPVSILSYRDLDKLAQGIPDPETMEKLQKQLTTPYSVNSVVSRVQNAMTHPSYIRVAQWNIARGGKVAIIRDFFLHPTEFYYKYKHNVKESDASSFQDEIKHITLADVICLNEVDVGMPRTDYKNITSELARILGYNYVYATEFVELTPVLYKQGVDKFRYKGLHGNAILSRFPIVSSKIIRLPECYDWYGSELKKKSPLETARRIGAKSAFDQTIQTEVRKGSRCALVTEIKLPDDQIVTVVSTHFEDRCFPGCRLEQMKHLLANLRNVQGPLVLAGDFNTSTTDTAPTSIRKELVKRLKDPHFLARQAAIAVTPGIPFVNNLVVAAVKKFIQYKDPAAPSIPVLFPNHERGLFDYLKSFLFADGRGFDFNGDSQRSLNGKIGFLSNSNERQLKGFESTFEFEEQRIIGYFKLDWFFIKPIDSKLKPFNGQTLKLLNKSYPGKISDHDPIIVDLAL